MDSSNPYQSPKQLGTKEPTQTVPIVSMRAILFVIGSSIVCGFIGAGLGALIGSLLPGYYRSVFSGGDSPNFDPVTVGIGQGLTQGILAGLFVGLGLVAIQTWYRLRSQR